MMNSPGVQSMMQQMSANPQMMQQVMQSPIFQTMMQNMASNPEMFQQVSSRWSQFHRAMDNMM